MQLDGLVVQVDEEVGLPVPLEARREERVEQGLQHGPRNRPSDVDRWRAKRPNRREPLGSRLQWTRVAPYDHTHLLHLILLGEGRHRRHRYEAEPAVDVLGRATNEVAPERHQLGRLFERPENRSAVHRADRVQPEEERGDDAEVAAAAAHRPEQVGVLIRIGGDEAAVGEHHIHLEQVVNRQAERAREVADAAAERQPADSRRGDEAARGRQPEWMCRVVYLAPQGATGDPRRPVNRVHADAFHVGEVDHEPVVDGAQPGAVVPAAAHRERQLLLAGKIHCCHHVCGIHTLRDQPGPPVNHAVVHFARRFVVKIAGLDQPATQTPLEVLHGCVVQCHRCCLDHVSLLLAVRCGHSFPVHHSR